MFYIGYNEDKTKEMISVSTNELLGLYNIKMNELKEVYHQYKENTEDGPEKRKQLRLMQIKMGRYIKKSVRLSKEEGYTTLEISKRLEIPESTVRRMLEG